MTVQAGRDYAVAAKTTWVFETGVANGTALITRGHLFIYPHSTMSASGAESPCSIDGRHPREAIMGLLGAPGTTAESLDAQMLKWCRQVKGPVAEPLATYKRVRVFQGFIRRSVVLSKKESGFEVGATGFRPSKAEIPAFIELFQSGIGPVLELK
jgi:hypothetical protein